MSFIFVTRKESFYLNKHHSSLMWIAINIFQEERENNLMETMDAEATAAKALEDLANAEEEISALEDLLKEHERDPSVGVELIRSWL